MSLGAAQPVMQAVPGLGQAMTVLQLLKSVNDVAGPKGALTQGDLMGAASGMSNIYGGVSGLSGAMGGGVQPTLQSTLGMSKDQFDAYPPEVRQELLRKTMGR